MYVITLYAITGNVLTYVSDSVPDFEEMNTCMKTIYHAAPVWLIAAGYHYA